MDAVFEAQFRLMKDRFARRGIQIEAAYRPDGEVDHIHRADRMLCIDTPETVALLRQVLPDIRWVDPETGRPQDDHDDYRAAGPAAGPDRRGGGLLHCTTDAITTGSMSVPETLDRIDARLGDDNPALTGDRVPLCTPDHIFHVARICPAVEPEVPGGDPALPWPAPRPTPGPALRDVVVGVSDTGLLADLDPARYPWLARVSGEKDLLGPPSAEGGQQIPEYTGHGTFVAGVAAAEAPSATIVVNDHFSTSGGELESVMLGKLDDLAAQRPDVINLSAGTYTRRNWTSLGFHLFNRRYSQIALVAAAGNDATDRPFYPAAYDWVVSVGALGTDQRHRAWFSNHGPWVDVYALGEGMVNAFADGVYTYHEPPRMPSRQTFAGMARWSGTSFSAPLVAGLVAERMARTGDEAPAAVAAVLALARSQVLPGVGPTLRPGDSA